MVYCKRSEITFFVYDGKGAPSGGGRKSIRRRNSGVEAARNEQFVPVYSIVFRLFADRFDVNAVDVELTGGEG